MRKPKYLLAIGLVVATMTLGVAMCAAQTSTNITICAERENLLEMLIEAYGTAPNATLENNGASLMQARAACDDGHITAAVAVYDRLIANMTASLKAQK
jgi:hypothetical protein